MMPGATLRPLTDREYLALTLYGEARGESLLGKIAVASVLRNRLEARRWGVTYASVCLAPLQFSCWNVNDPNLPLLRAIGNELTAGTVRDDAALRQCLWIADGLIGNGFDSNVDQATHYFATSMQTPPAWAATGTYVARIGAHLFFEHVP